MNKTCLLRICLLLLVALMWWPAQGAMRKRKLFARNAKDSVTQTVVPVSAELPSVRKMSSSAYPVSISVSGRAVKIQSDHSQLLPIYTQGGVLYLTTRLNKGTNWLNGLPRGRYFINNRPITIN